MSLPRRPEPKPLISSIGFFIGVFGAFLYILLDLNLYSTGILVFGIDLSLFLMITGMALFIVGYIWRYISGKKI